jgi:hypothetical protein|tara:strand:- start:7994 stop:8401 length:408 start_codon:yes stop_codon:yes gene_type:complete
MAQYIEQEYKDGDWKGFKFTVKQFDSTAEAVESIGEDNILSLVNQQFASRVRAKVKNSLPKGLNGEELATAQQRLTSKHADGVLFSREDVDKWRPDQREVTPTALFKMAKEAFKADDHAKGAELLAKMQELMEAA